jgi:hypothetical protein
MKGSYVLEPARSVERTLWQLKEILAAAAFERLIWQDSMRRKSPRK